MNEKLKSLEDQCWVKVPCDFDMRANGSSTIQILFDVKKFATLIVKHCASFVEDNFDLLGDEIFIKEKMLEYFEVKE